MTRNILSIIENMASYGTAPEEGCSLFGVGYEQEFRQLRRTYLERRFANGGSADKIVIGPFGSGKTHFLHQLMEVAREANCATAKVTLNKDIDFTQSLIVMREIAREIRLPDGEGHGVKHVIRGAIERIRTKTESPEQAQLLMRGWLGGLEKADFELQEYGRVLSTACRAYHEGSAEPFELACRWLSGDFEDKALCAVLGVSPILQSERNLYAKRAMFTLFQFIRRAGYQGSVVCYDEAEQGFAVEKKKVQKIHSMLMAGINAVTELKEGSVLFVYALTPELVDQMDTFAALQQRLADPGPGQSFFEGNPLAPKIDMRRRTGMLEDLQSIARRLVELMYTTYGQDMPVSKEASLERAIDIAERVYAEDLSTSNRRTLVKEVCTMLLLLYDQGSEAAAGAEPLESEV